MVNMLSRLRQKKTNYLEPTWKIGKLLDYQLRRRKTVYHGSEYGGWTIVPENLSESAVIYSFGIGEDASFDLEVIKHYCTDVYAFDPTPKSTDWVNRQTWPPQFHFHPIGIGASDRKATFFPPENPNHVSHTIIPQPSVEGETVRVQLHRLRTIADMLGHNEIMILKLDIEGAEYEVIEDLINTPEIKVQQILVEFHHFLPNIEIEDTKEAIHKLKGVGYKIFNISRRSFEYSFIRL